MLLRACQLVPVVFRVYELALASTRPWALQRASACDPHSRAEVRARELLQLQRVSIVPAVLVVLADSLAELCPRVRWASARPRGPHGAVLSAAAGGDG